MAAIFAVPFRSSGVYTPAPGPFYVPSRMLLSEVTEGLGLDFDADSTNYVWDINDDRRSGGARKPLSTWAGKLNLDTREDAS